MNKKDLRSVSYHFGQGTFFIGYFHQWLTKKDSKGNEIAVALIEDLQGGMIEIESQYVVFKN